MKYAVELYFDKKTEKRLSDMAQKVADEKISTRFLEFKKRPHITLACFNNADEESCIKKLKKFAENHQIMPAYIGSIGMFTDTKTIFVSPIMNSSMFGFQRELFEYLKDFDTKGYEWYYPDRWVPHCALALTADDSEDAFYQASNLLLHEFEKIAGKFVEIGLVRITLPVEEIFSVNLN